MKRINYNKWENCYLIANDDVELVVTTDVGPRIIRFGFPGERNEFCEVAEEQGKTGGDTWRVYGGHRLWHAPEVAPRTYHPDNLPVKIAEHAGFVRVTQPTESSTGIQKEMDIYMPERGAQARIVHRLINHNLWMVELAPWSISVMAAGGRAIIPLPPRQSHAENFLPVNSIALWGYTEMCDPRWTWGKKYIFLQQTPEPKVQKCGFYVPDGWGAYANQGHCFIKKFTCYPDKNYPDLNSTMETFTNEFMLEVETLGPVTRMEPGGQVEHEETWLLYRDVPEIKTEEDVESYILPKLV